MLFCGIQVFAVLPLLPRTMLRWLRAVVQHSGQCACLLSVLTGLVAMKVSETAEAAFECWWQDQHPGWMIFTLGNNHFESLDQIIKARSLSAYVGV